MIQCPHCGRVGRLPDDCDLSNQSLRCRKCDGRFTARTQIPAEVMPNGEPALESDIFLQPSGEIERLSSDDFLGSLDDDEENPAKVISAMTHTTI